eukprot:37281-Rhodomonas_salina.1
MSPVIRNSVIANSLDLLFAVGFLGIPTGRNSLCWCCGGAPLPLPECCARHIFSGTPLEAMMHGDGKQAVHPLFKDLLRRPKVE